MAIKVPTNMRLDPLVLRLLAKLRKKLSLTRTGVMELAVRRLAELEKIK
jgi:hypothetical protein